MSLRKMAEGKAEEGVGDWRKMSFWSLGFLKGGLRDDRCWWLFFFEVFVFGCFLIFLGLWGSLWVLQFVFLFLSKGFWLPGVFEEYLLVPSQTYLLKASFGKDELSS